MDKKTEKELRAFLKSKDLGKVMSETEVRPMIQMLLDERSLLLKGLSGLLSEWHASGQDDNDSWSPKYKAVRTKRVKAAEEALRFVKRKSE